MRLIGGCSCAGLNKCKGRVERSVPGLCEREARSSRHNSIRKISEIVRPSLRATSLFVSPVGSLANISHMSKPFSRAGGGDRLEAFGAFVFINRRSKSLG